MKKSHETEIKLIQRENPALNSNVLNTGLALGDSQHCP